MTKRHKVIREKAEAALKASGIDFPLVVLLAMIKQEAPRQGKDGESLSNTGDGVMQVTHESGNRGGQYGNTDQGIINNLTDGLATLKGFLTSAGGDTAKAVSMYNGGNNEDRGDADYTQNVAKRITNGEVAANFGEEFAKDKLSEGDKKTLKALEKYKRLK